MSPSCQANREFLPRTNEILLETTLWNDWKIIGLEAIHWINILLLLRNEATIPSDFITIPAEAQSQPILTFGNVELTSAKYLFWSSAIFRLSSVNMLEKKKEIAFYSLLLRDSLKMETNAVRLFLSYIVSFQYPTYCLFF